MNSNPNSPDDPNPPAKRRWSRSGKFAVLIVALYGIVAAGLSYGSLPGHILYVGLLSSAFLAIYAAGPLAIVLWTGFMIRRIFARGKYGSTLKAALKSAIIIFGTIGLALWTASAIRPNAETLSAGYWIHAKIRIDVNEIRSWAASREPSADRFEPIDPEQWPESLRRVSIRGGTVTCDPETHTVIFHEGGQYMRWGITVAGPQTAPPGDRSEIELESGAWVWCE